MFIHRRIVDVLCIISLIIGCQAVPPIVEEIVANPTSTVLVNDDVRLSVNAMGTDLKYKWTAERGRLSVSDKPSVTFTAPDSPGLVIVSVKVTSGRNATEERTITLQVIETILSPTPSPTDSPTPTFTPSVEMTPTTLPPSQGALSTLRQLLVERFNDQELRDLCFELDVDYDSLPGDGKADKARELLLFLERRGRIQDLIETGTRIRPDINWTDIIEFTHTTEVTPETSLKCNDEYNIPVESEQLLIVIADFEEFDDTHVEDDLASSLSEELRGQNRIAVCRIEQPIGSQTKAQDLGNELGAAAVVWGYSESGPNSDPDSGLFKLGLEVAGWPLKDQGTLPHWPSDKLKDAEFRWKELPQLTTLLVSLTLSQIFFIDGQVVMARDVLDSALNETRTDTDFVDRNSEALAEAYYFLGFLFGPPSDPDSVDHRLAAQAYKEALSLDPSLDGARLNQGRAYEKLKEWDEAINAYTWLIESESLLAAEALVNRGLIRLRYQSDFEAFETDFEAAIELNPVSGYIARSTVRLYMLRDYAGAAEDLSELIKLEPAKPGHYRLLGLAQLRAGRLDEAEQTYRSSLCYLNDQIRDKMLNDLASHADKNPDTNESIATIISTLESAPMPPAC